jgi:hypothetical protein
MFAKGSLFYLFLMLAQINFIFSDNVHIWLTVTKYPSNDNGSFSFDVFLSSIAVKTFTGLYMSSTAGVLEEAGTAYPSLAPGFIPGFWWGSYCSSV